MPKRNQLNIRLSDDERRTLDTIEAETGLKDQAVMQALVRALIKAYLTHRELRFPFLILPTASAASAGAAVFDGKGQHVVPGQAQIVTDAVDEGTRQAHHQISAETAQRELGSAEHTA
jgi:hypothetical protein